MSFTTGSIVNAINNLRDRALALRDTYPQLNELTNNVDLIASRFTYQSVNRGQNYEYPNPLNVSSSGIGNSNLNYNIVVIAHISAYGSGGDTQVDVALEESVNNNSFISIPSARQSQTLGSGIPTTIQVVRSRTILTGSSYRYRVVVRNVSDVNQIAMIGEACSIRAFSINALDFIVA